MILRPLLCAFGEWRWPSRPAQMGVLEIGDIARAMPVLRPLKFRRLGPKTWRYTVMP